MKIFIYPTFNDKTGINTYLKLFHKAFAQAREWKYINRVNYLRVLGILFNLDAKCFIFNWPENIVQRKFGRVQIILFIIILFVIKLLGKHIVWILHNKQPHNGKTRTTSYIMRFMASKATCVITHSMEGVSYFDKVFPDNKGKCYYIPHPVYSTRLYHTVEGLSWDYIIWGGIEKRKNILEFVKYAKHSPYWLSKKILICGKYSSEEYYQEILKECYSNIDIIARRLSDDELCHLILKSKNILFTYGVESTLSSGALIYSINFGKPIIGPEVGSFKDLQPMVSCYTAYDEIEKIRIESNEDLCKQYILSNTWEAFPKKLFNIMISLVSC